MTEPSIARRYAWLLADEFAAISREAATAGLPARSVRRDACITPDGTHLSYLRWGTDSPRAVFLHGGGLNAHSWDSVLLRLRDGAVVPDLPGHGESSWRADFDYRPAVIARALAPLLSTVAAGPVVLVGQSLGALAAIELAAAHPGRVTCLVIVDITPGRDADRPGSEQIRRFINARADFASYEEVVEHALGNGIGSDRGALERGVVLNTRLREDGRIVFKHHFASPPAGAGAEAGAEAHHSDITHLWTALEGLDRTRVLLVRGTRGIVDDAQVAEFRRRLPAAQVIDIAAGHNVQRDAPQELASAISSFVGIAGEPADKPGSHP